jgi:hypothetical protein
MTPEKRQAVLAAVMIGLLALAAAWSASRMLRERDGARRAAGDLAECTRLAADIQALRARRRVAANEASGVQELHGRIEAASRRANLGGGALRGVIPQAARRVGASPYLLKPTELVLRGVTLEQVATFLFHVGGDSGLTVRDLRLQTPRSAPEQNLWDAEATVTYLVYAPPEAADSNK